MLKLNSKKINIKVEKYFIYYSRATHFNARLQTFLII